MTSPSRPSLAQRWPAASRAWIVVLACYGLLYGAFLLKTDGYPYVLDNNESYSCWWHARSLFENGAAHTKGLTDEVFSTQPAASPYVHTHQGNLPRLYTFLLYALGFRSIAAQIWITTFTVGLAGIWFAFRFLSGLANPRYAAIACLVMMTNYLLFAQWQVSLYNVWHVFFFFSSLLCVRALGRPDHRARWALLALLNFAAFFYWEYVFTAFVTILAGLYALALYWRRPLTMLRTWLLVGLGAALAAAVLLAQLVAYMGWDGVKEDVRLTLTARNTAADPVLLERVTSFYREHGIIFWHNFLDAAPLRTLTAFWDSLAQHHLRYYTAPLILAMFLAGLGWLSGQWPARGSLSACRVWRWPAATAGGLKWLGLTGLLGWIVPMFFAAADRPPPPWPILWPAVALLGLLLGRCWLGGWWAWPRLGWIRFFLMGAFLVAAGAVLHPASGLADTTFQESLAETAGWNGLEILAGLIPPGALLLGLTCAALGNAQVLGRARALRLTSLPVLFLCTVLAYAATYRLFTGYVYSGYLHRMVPMLVFFTDMLLAVVVYAASRMLARHTWPRIFPALLLALLLGHWVHLQWGYARVARPDSYAFLSVLEKAPYKNLSLVSNTYPAPMAARTGAWGYSDPSIFSGRLSLTPRGFEMERDLKYLWFADRDTNRAYLKPELAITVIQTPNIATAIQLKRERAESAPGTLPLGESVGLVQRTQPLQQPFLRHRLTYSDGNHVSIVRLDWDYPPFLRPDIPRFLPSVARLSVPEKLALSASTQGLRRRWRITLGPVDAVADQAMAIDLRNASIDGQPLFSAADMAAAGWQSRPAAGLQRPGTTWQLAGQPVRPVTALADGNRVNLAFGQDALAGKIRVEVNDFAENLDFRSDQPGKQGFSFISASPHGQYTAMPDFTPGSCVQTTLWPGSSGVIAEVLYHYAHQENIPEECTKVRVYAEDQAGRWRLADCISFLGPAGVPVRLEEFQRANPDTVEEYARIARAGETRTYEQWLADHLTAHPAEWSRAGIIQASLPPPSPTVATGGSLVARRLLLPAGDSAHWQVSVTPGTRTKSGPEYFGVPFSLAKLHPDSRKPTPVEFDPPAVAPDLPLPFGRIKLRLRFPPNRWPQSEPLVSTGIQEAGDFIYAYYPDAHHVRIGFDHWFRGGPLSPPIPIDFTKEHTMEISIGSLFPSPEAVVFANISPAGIASVKNRVVVVLDGRTIIDSAGDCYETGPDTVTVGRNGIKGTLSGPVFFGEILSIERVWPDIK